MWAISYRCHVRDSQGRGSRLPTINPRCPDQWRGS